MIDHEGQREGAEDGDGGGELCCQEVDHGDGEGSEDKGYDAEVPFWFCEWVELVGENEKKGRVEESGVLIIEFYLAFEIIPGVVEGIDFIQPEGFLVKSMESQYKAYDKTKNEDKNLLLPYATHSRKMK
jgi:hypothetical protein